MVAAVGGATKAFSLIASLLIGSMVDGLLSAEWQGYALGIVLLLIGMQLMASWGSWIHETISIRAGAAMEHSLRMKLYRSMKAMDWLHFTAADTGTWQQRIAGDTAAVASACQSYLHFVTTVAIFGITTFTFICIKSVLFLPLFLLLIFFGSLLHGKKVKEIEHRSAKLRNNLYRFHSYLMDVLQLRTLFLAHRTEGCEGAFFERRSRLLQKKTAGAFLLMQNYRFSIILAIWGVYAAALLLSFYLYHRGYIRIGDIVMCHILMTELIGAVLMVADLLPMLDMGEERTRALDSILQQPAPVSPPAPTPVSSDAPIVMLNDVSFQYERSARPILQHLSFAIHPGEAVFIFGANGAGKSTLSRILLGMYTPQAGEVSRCVSSQAYVPHTSYVATMSLLENLRLYEQGISPEESLTLLRRFVPGYADATEDMLYNCVEHSSFSDGQRQCIGIVRALLRKPELLVLDEITHSLDAASHAYVYQALNHIKPDVALVGISHQLPPEGLYDRYLFLHEGILREVDRGFTKRFFDVAI